jgi:hypothetical protein
MKARFVLLAALLVGGSALAQAYNYLDFRMVNNAADPFPYWVNDRDLPLPVGQVEAAAQGAFDLWDSVSCASTAFAYQGLASTNSQIASPSDPNDTFNVSANFVVDPSDPNYQYVLGGGAAFASSVELTYAGTLYQCDLYLNDVADSQTGARPHWTTVTPTPADGLDVQTFLAHEVGHCQGLGHSLELEDLMRPDLDYGVQIETPSAHDEGALCNAYPVDGRIGSPCPPASCDSGLSCVSAPRADGGTFPAICTQGCTPGDPNSGCPMPYACQPSSDVPGYTGACVPVDGNVTQVGKACAGNAQCGAATSICETGGTLPSGNETWPDGYCTEDCVNDPCPPESACTDFGNGVHLCLKSCRVGSGDCRAGYTCAQTNAAATPICEPQCHADVDCGSGFKCRTCDGTCLAVQNPSATIGSACTQDAECGMGQTCFLDGASVGVCTQGCATACGACPTGTTCHPAGENGDLMCLRDCVSGTCESGLQCAQLTTGQGCLPGCTQDSQCPVGDVCHSGECVLENAPPPDAGCTSCTPPDGGTGGTDGGSGGSDGGTNPGQGGSSGAFGCELAGGHPGEGSWVAVLPWLLLLCVFGGRSWRSRI